MFTNTRKTGGAESAGGDQEDIAAAVPRRPLPEWADKRVREYESENAQTDARTYFNSVYGKFANTTLFEEAEEKRSSTVPSEMGRFLVGAQADLQKAVLGINAVRLCIEQKSRATKNARQAEVIEAAGREVLLIAMKDYDARLATVQRLQADIRKELADRTATNNAEARRLAKPYEEAAHAAEVALRAFNAEQEILDSGFGVSKPKKP